MLTAPTTAGAAVGSYQFSVARLVTSQQSVSAGFVDPNATMKAGTVTIEMGGGNLNTSTPLAMLNGGVGVRRGQFRIADRSGTPVARGENLQLKWVGEATSLATLNGGKGITPGSFKITNSRGGQATVGIADGGAKMLGDIIKAVNTANAGVTASINANGRRSTSASRPSGPASNGSSPTSTWRGCWPACRASSRRWPGCAPRRPRSAFPGTVRRAGFERAPRPSGSGGVEDGRGSSRLLRPRQSARPLVSDTIVVGVAGRGANDGSMSGRGTGRPSANQTGR